MVNLLVTGGAGFIGSNFAAAYKTEYPETSITIVDSLTYAGDIKTMEEAGLKERCNFLQLDICETSALADLIRQQKINAVVHFAAQTHVDRSHEDPDPFVHSNILGTHSLLNAVRMVWPKKPPPDEYRFHHISTDEVFGPLPDQAMPFSENAPYRPTSPYAASKAASDHLVNSFTRSYGLPATVSYCSNNFGSLQSPEKFIPMMITHILQGKEVPVYGDGEQLRDWLHVGDHCMAVTQILHRGEPGSAYNIATGIEHSNNQIAQLVCDLLDERFELDETAKLKERYPDSPMAQSFPAAQNLTHVDDRPAHDRRYGLDTTRLRTEIGFEPNLDFAAQLAQTIDWYLDHPDWWRHMESKLTQ